MHATLEKDLLLPTGLLDAIWVLETHFRPITMRLTEYLYFGVVCLFHVGFHTRLPRSLTLGPYQVHLGFVIRGLPEPRCFAERLQNVLAVWNAYTMRHAALTAAKLLSPLRNLPLSKIGHHYQGSEAYGQILEALVADRQHSQADQIGSQTI